MRYKIKYNLTANQADKLIEKYYEGFTTVEEERQLKTFLAQADLPERFKAEQAIFGYFETKQSKPSFSLHPYIRWVGVAVIILVFGLGTQIFRQQNLSDYAFINGEKITDKQLVRYVAENSMKEISRATEDKLQKFDAKELMKQQLGAFAE